MKRFFLPIIAITAAAAFVLRPPAEKTVQLRLAPLAAFPEQISGFHAASENNALLRSEPFTDGTVGLERAYTDGRGTRLDVYLAPQILGQHVPAACLNYAGDSVVSTWQRILAGKPAIMVNQISVQTPGADTKSSCLYYWKTADGSFAPDPSHSIREMAWLWYQDHPGVLVEVCTEDAGPASTAAMEAFVRASYPETARLYPSIFDGHR